MRIVIVGLGGVGSILLERLSRFLNYSMTTDQKCLVLVDGDSYEVKNYERQEFENIGSKSEIKCREVRQKYSSLQCIPITTYIDDNNIKHIIKEGDIVFLCVDNHKTRKIVSDYVSRNLKNFTIISGGNDLVDGNVQIYIRKDGKDLTPSLVTYHPEIDNPRDKHPSEMSCEELANSQPQLYFTNLWVATIMCCAFYNIVVKNDLKASEIYFDIIHMSSVAQNRQVI